MQKPGIFGILELSEPFRESSEPCDIYENRSTLCKPRNSELWHIGNPGIFRTPTYLKLNTYSKPSQKFNMAYFVKTVVEGYKFFYKAFYLRFLIYAHLSINIL